MHFKCRQWISIGSSGAKGAETLVTPRQSNAALKPRKNKVKTTFSFGLVDVFDVLLT